MSRLPFKEVEAARPDFDAGNPGLFTKSPNPGWKPGDGLNVNLPNAADFDPKVPRLTVNPAENDTGMVYKLLISAITPRPIAFLSTVSLDGIHNLAPMSYFNMVANDPPAIVISVAMNPGGKGLKDTAVNIKETGEFTLNIISEPFLEAANYTSIDAPRDIDEWKLSGLTQHKSDLVKPPYVGESAVSLECTLLHSHELSGKGGNLTHTIMIGKIERIHVRKKETVLNDDKEQPVVIPEKLKPVSRLGGITFGRAVQFMEVPRPSWEAVKDTEEVVQALAGEVKTV